MPRQRLGNNTVNLQYRASSTWVQLPRERSSTSSPCSCVGQKTVMTLGTAVALDVTLAAAATFLGERTALPCADSIIYATAQPRGAEVWTHDGHFRGLPGVRFVETPAAPRAAPLRGALDLVCGKPFKPRCAHGMGKPSTVHLAVRHGRQAPFT